MARFTLLYNEVCPRYVEWVLEKRNEDVIRDISILLKTDKKLTKVGSNSSSESYSLPGDYFNFSNLQVYASKGKCKNQKLLVFEIKSDDSEELLADVNNEPSFEWRETFYFMTQKQVKIFRSDFTFDKVTMSYYQNPRKIDIAGYVNTETGAPSQNVDPEFDDRVVMRILLGMSKQFAAINSDSAKYSLDKDTLFGEL